MKPIPYLLILLSLFLTFSCEDKEEELPNELSLDWILLKKGVDTEFYVESCDGYIEYDGISNTSFGWNCKCDDYNYECGDCRLKNISYEYVESCDGYNLCDDDYDYDDYDCCWFGEFGGYIYYSPPLWYEYKLYWNDDLSVCSGNNCDEEDLGNYDIVIPSNIPKQKTYDCDGGGCESETYFHPNCDTPLDTTFTIGSKNISFEKIGLLDRENYSNSLGYITYLRNEDYLQTDGDDIDIGNWKVVDYQRKE